VEALEQENANLRAEVGKKSAQSVGHSKPVSPSLTKIITAHVGSTVSNTEERSARHNINRALDNMPKDDPRREMTATAHLVPVSTVSPVVQQWSGIYIGINAGYGQGEVDSWGSGPYVGQPFSTNGSPAYTITSGSSIFTGPVVGGQIGYNHHFSNNIILGFEADMDYADINDKYGNNSTRGSTMIIGNQFTQLNSQHSRTGVDWLGTARLRLGYDMGKFMPYLTGGLAYGGITTNALGGLLSSNYSSLGTSTYSFLNGSIGGANKSTVQLGWSAGAGGELIVANNLSIRGEYLYTQLGGVSYGAGGSSLTSSYLSGSTPPYTLNTGAGWAQIHGGPFGIHQARIGVNYHTDWLANKPAVVAKY
jgi:outer membrane immunogenic protein